MGYFDKLTETAFKEGENGVTIYYPDGVLGKGRIIDDPILKEKIFKFHKRFIKYLIPLACIYGMLLGLGQEITLNGLMPMIIIGILVFLRQRILIKGLPIHNKKLTVKEALKSVHTTLLIISIANAVFLVITGLSMPFVLNKSIDEIQTIIFIPVALGVFLLSLSIYIYKLKKSNQAPNNNAQ